MWSKKYDKCVDCGTVEKKYICRGLCCTCYARKDRAKNPEIARERIRKYRRTEKAKNTFKKYRESNSYKEINKRWMESEKGKKYHKEYSKSDKMKEWMKEYKRNKRKNNLHYKLKCNISTLIGNRLRSRLSSKNWQSTFSFLPYTVDELKIHLENLFKSGMSWQNYGDWHIDHIRPDCKFDYKNVEDEEFKRCWALENLQPLWAEENLSKGSN